MARKGRAGSIPASAIRGCFVVCGNGGDHNLPKGDVVPLRDHFHPPVSRRSVRRFNLYAELLSLLNRSDPTFDPPPPAYAATSRKRQEGRRTKLDTWSRALSIGQPLPILPVWLSRTETLTLDLELSYEETCRVLRIP